MRERRKVPRYPLGIVGKLHVARGSVSADVVLQVISTLGCALERADGASVGKKCELYFDWEDVQIGVEAQAVWKDAKGRVGLKFLSVDKDTQKRLNELCATLRGQPLSAPQREEAERARPLADSAKPREAARSARPPAAEPAPPSRSARPPGERERRRVPRYVSDLPTRLSNLPSGASLNVTPITLSILGGCVEGSGLPQPGQKCELITEWEAQTLRIEAEVAWKGKEQIGFKFTSLGAEAEQLLRQICANLRLQPLAPLPPEPSE